MHHAHDSDDAPTRPDEWHAAGPSETKPNRPHSRPASYGMLAALITLLILNGCNNKGPEGPTEQASEPAGAMQEEAGPLYDNTTAGPGPAQEAGAMQSDAGGPVDEKTEPPAEDAQQQ